MYKDIDIKYNLASIKVFLNVFDLTLEEKEVSINDHLNIFMKDNSVGQVKFKEEKIEIESLSKYGVIEGGVNYADCFRLQDIESLMMNGKMGLYANWNNTFDFKVNFFNGSVLRGNIKLDIKIDNEFGNHVFPHIKLKYIDYEKEYDIRINVDSYPFKFIEKRKNFREEILYNLFNSYGNDPYIEHIKRDEFSNGIDTCDYYESNFVSKNEKDNKFTSIRKFNNRCIHYDCREFSRITEDDDTKEILNKIKFMSQNDPTMYERIHRLMEEFSIDGSSFMEKILILGFENYNNEEVQALFKINKDNYDLKRIYFEGNVYRLEKK